MRRVVKSAVRESADTPRKLIAIDLKDDKNLLSRDKIGVGIDAVSEMVKAKCNDLCLLYTSPSPRDGLLSRMPSSA